MNISISNEIVIEEKSDLTKVFQESDYTQRNIEAFQYLRNKDYQSAKNAYKECVNYAKQNDDDYKFADSLTNYGITQFFCGKVKEALESFESSQRINQRLLKSPHFKQNTQKITSLYIKTLSNLCLANLSVCNVKDSMTYFNTLYDTINSEKDSTFKQTLLKEVFYIFFRAESLVNYVEIHHKYSFNLKEKVQVTNETKDLEEVHQSIVNRILFYFHKYLRENDLDSWIKCLTEEGENFKFIKDYNGFIFAVFNNYSSLYLKDQEANANQSKIKIASLCKVLVGDKERSEIEEKSADKILAEMKEKMTTSVEIYQKLYELEKSLMRDDSYISDLSYIKIPANSSKVLIKLFLKHALNSLNNREETNPGNDKYIKQMTWQINLTLQLIEKEQIDCNSLQIHKIDPEVSRSLTALFDNLLWIKYKCIMNKYFKNFMYETLGYMSREDLRFIKERKFENFEKKHLQVITDGSILTKINFNSSGKKEHFYKLDPSDSTIRIFEKKADKNFKQMYIRNLRKFTYGIASENLRKKFKSMQGNQLSSPWLFFSIIKKDRSVDLYMEEQQLVNWFYGLRRHLKEKGINYKIFSVGKFVLTRMKLKLISKLKEEKDNKQYKDVINNILQEKGVQNFSFVKILLLFLKIKKVEY